MFRTKCLCQVHIYCYFVLVLSSCLTGGSVNNSVNNINKEGYCPITDWYIFIDTLDPQQTNLTNPSHFITHAKSIGINNKSAIMHHTNIDYIDFKEFVGQGNLDTIFYALAIIESSRKQNATIMSGNRRGMEVWFNGKKVFESSRGEHHNSYNQYLNYINISLQKGKNDLLIKHHFSNQDDTWNSNVLIASEEFSKDYYYRKSNFDLISSIFVDRDCDIELVNRYYPEGNEYSYAILDRYMRPIVRSKFHSKGHFKIELPNLHDGLHYISVQFPDFEVCEPFYYGNIDSALVYYLNQIDNIKGTNSQDAIHLEAIRLRLQHLIRFRAKPGQLTSFFEIDISDNHQNYIRIYTGGSKSTKTEDCVIPVNKAVRYIKFTGRMNAANSYNNIAEMAINDEAGLAIDDIGIEASGYFGSEIPENAIDKDYNTAWSQEGDGRWLEVDLLRERYVQSVSFAFKESIYDPEVEVKLWERKIILLLTEIEKHLQNNLKGKDLFNQTPGRHLRGYVSEIANDTLNYSIQVPSAISEGKPLPLVIFFPIDMGTRSPFLMSMLAADILKDDKISIETERYKMMTAVISGNNYESYLMPMFYSELNSILDDIMSDFPIDTTRIYLFGVCASAAKSLQYAETLPHKVAAIASTSPAFHYENYERIKNLSNIPMLYIHSREDEHTSIEQLEHYYDKAVQSNIYPEVILFKNSSHYAYSNSFLNLSYSFFKDKVTNYSPAEINFSTRELKYNTSFWMRLDDINYEGSPNINARVKKNIMNIHTSDIFRLTLLVPMIPFNNKNPLKIVLNGNEVYNSIPTESEISLQVKPNFISGDSFQKNPSIEGPINHFFTNKFIIVKGTMGTEKDKDNSTNLSNYLKDLWKEYYYNDCIEKADINITNEDINESNLILTGSPETNSLIKRIEKDLPIQFTDDGFFFRNKFYENNYKIAFIYPNPLNLKKYILIVGGSKISLGKLRPNSFMFTENSDFVILDGEKNEVIQRGSFNSSWR